MLINKRNICLLELKQLQFKKLNWKKMVKYYKSNRHGYKVK